MIVFDIEVRGDYRSKLNGRAIYKTLMNNSYFQKIYNYKGIYMMYNHFGEILYIGQTHRFGHRFASHAKLQEGAVLKEISKMRFFAAEAGELVTKEEMDDLENALISKTQARFNDSGRKTVALKYADEYATKMLKLACSDLSGVIRSYCLANYNSMFSSHIRREITLDIDREEADWGELGLPTSSRLTLYNKMKGISIDDLATAYGLPRKLIEMKVNNTSYINMLKGYYYRYNEKEACFD